MERGRHRLFLDQVYAAAEALHVPLDALLPTLADIFPATPVTRAPHATVTDKSVRAILGLVRTIQESAALENARKDDIPMVHSHGNRS
jgi:hypothetical protein